MSRPKMSRKGKIKTIIVVLFVVISIYFYVVKKIPGEDEANLYANHLTYNNTVVSEVIDPKDKTYFEYQENTYYLLEGSLFSEDGNTLAVLGNLPDGLFIDRHYLYYVYGYERRMRIFSIKEEIFEHFRRYKYGRYDFETGKVEKIEKEQYLELYNQLENQVR